MDRMPLGSLPLARSNRQKEQIPSYQSQWASERFPDGDRNAQDDLLTRALRLRSPASRVLATNSLAVFRGSARCRAEEVTKLEAR
jgi:hypothetical protein